MLTVDFALFPINRGERVLDLGCGSGRHSWHICKLNHCSLCAADLDLESLQKNRYMLGEIDRENGVKGKWNVLQGNAMRLPFKDGSFDKIICSEVMEHVVDDEQAARELFRVLKDGGLLSISVPEHMMESIYWKLSEDYHTNPGGHIRIYRKRQLIDLMCRNNLSLYAIRHKHALHSIYWLLRCIFGVRNEKARIPAAYHGFLAWELDTKLKFFRRLERILDNVFPKSLVIYLRKSPGTSEIR